MDEARARAAEESLEAHGIDAHPIFAGKVRDVESYVRTKLRDAKVADSEVEAIIENIRRAANLIPPGEMSAQLAPGVGTPPTGSGVPSANEFAQKPVLASRHVLSAGGGSLPGAGGD